MTLADPRRLTPQQRRAAAERIRTVPVPPRSSPYFNSSPCEAHAELEQGCRHCGVRLRAHQRTGSAWLWVAMKGLLGDSVGLGKTFQVAYVLALMRETGELSPDNRCVVVCRAAAVTQWAAELRRVLPGLPVMTADGAPDERARSYLTRWQVCVISDRTLSPSASRDGDVELLRRLPVGMLVYDDLDAVRNGSTRTAYAVKRLARDCTRVYAVHGTPLQKRLKELYYFTEPLGSREIFGTMSEFTQRYVSRSKKILWVRDKRDPTGRRRRKVVIWLDTGVKENALPEFKRLIGPLVLRRTVDDLDDVELPRVQPNTVWLDLLPEQQHRMAELKAGTLRRLRERGAEVSPVEAGAAFTRARQINSGLATLDDGNDVSVKLDWCMDMLTGDLSAGKVVVFVYFKPNIAALSARLDAQGIGHVLMWSEETGKAERERRLTAFRDDPDCRVLVGSPTIEASLNLQVAGHLIACDQIWNPQRMEQLLGRIRRQGSRHGMVVFHQLLIRGTVDEDFLPLMGREQGLSDSVWDDHGEIYSAVSPRRLMEMVARQAA